MTSARVAGIPTAMTGDANTLDVLIVGAGISGISMAAHMQRMSPERSFAILERRENLGGT